MNRMKWKVMKAFGKLPSSPDIQALNDVQWVWCYLNIVEDQREEEELWKERFKYMGLFVNPKMVTEVLKREQKLSNTPKNSSVFGMEDTPLNSDNPDAPIYTSDAFEEELKRAMVETKTSFMELQPDGVYGDPNMSSDEFINSMVDNIDKYQDLQVKIDSERVINHQTNNDDDLDTFEIDE